MGGTCQVRQVPARGVPISLSHVILHLAVFILHPRVAFGGMGVYLTFLDCGVAGFLGEKLSPRDSELGDA